MESSEALWVGDGIRVRADGVLEDWAGGSIGWVPYRSTVWASDAQAIAQAFASVSKQMESFRQALPESERGPGWEQAVLTAIDTRREVLAAVDAHVPGWDPARPVSEVVEHLADELGEALDWKHLHAATHAAREEALAERDAAKAEVERLADEIIAWKRLHAEEKVDGYRVRVERDDMKARLAAAEEEAETYRKQGEADWNACCDVLTWARAFGKDLPPPSRAVAAVCERVRELDPMFPGPKPEPVSPTYEFGPNDVGHAVAKSDAADAVLAIRPALVTDRYTEGIAVACEEFAHRLGLDVGHGPPNAVGYGEARLQAHLARYRATEPTSPVYAMGPDTVWTNGRIRVHRSGTVQIGPHWDAIQDGDLQALGAAMVRMRQDLLATDPYVSRVAEFHRAMGLPVRNVPFVGTVEERVLRVRLLLEEVFEYATASAVRVELAGFRIKGTGELTIGENVGATADLVAMTHELGDCQVIVSGCAVQLGLPLLAAVAEEIHPANMRKLGPDGRPVLRADGKVGKPEGWQPANVARIVERALTSGEVSHG